MAGLTHSFGPGDLINGDTELYFQGNLMGTVTDLSINMERYDQVVPNGSGPPLHIPGPTYKTFQAGGIVNNDFDLNAPLAKSPRLRLEVAEKILKKHKLWEDYKEEVQLIQISKQL